MHTEDNRAYGVVMMGADADFAGANKANLRLFRRSTNGWQEATCAGYAIESYSFILPSQALQKCPSANLGAPARSLGVCS